MHLHIISFPVFLLLTTPLVALLPETLPSPDIHDTTILNLFLTLSYLQLALYNSSLSTFKPIDFTLAGFQAPFLHQPPTNPPQPPKPRELAHRRFASCWEPADEAAAIQLSLFGCALFRRSGLRH